MPLSGFNLDFLVRFWMSLSLMWLDNANDERLNDWVLFL